MVSRDRAATQWPAERGLPSARVRARGQQRYWRVRDAHHPGSCGRRGEVYRQAIRRAERTYAQVRYTTMVAITVCPRGASVPVRVRHDAVSGASTWGTCCPQGTLTGRNTADALRRGKTPCRRRETTHQPPGRVTYINLRVPSASAARSQCAGSPMSLPQSRRSSRRASFAQRDSPS